MRTKPVSIDVKNTKNTIYFWITSHFKPKIDLNICSNENTEFNMSDITKKYIVNTISMKLV